MATGTLEMIHAAGQLVARVEAFSMRFQRVAWLGIFGAALEVLILAVQDPDRLTDKACTLLRAVGLL